MWNTLTAQIREEIYYPLKSCKLFFEERKGSHRSTELLYVDQHILNDSKMRQKKTSYGLDDFKKAYDIVPQSWKLHCLKMYKILDEIRQFIEKTMETYRVELTAGGKSLAEVMIKQDIFQGDALSPLQFVIVMMPLNHILRKCTAG